MQNVTVFLRTALFTLGLDDGHVPPGVAIVQGDAKDVAGGLEIVTTRLLDERGRVLAERQVKLMLPWGKIDHLHLPNA